MNFDESNHDGSDSFWPGYVDAVTNLVLNLLFLLTIMTVAVFMFALELGRASLGGTGVSQSDALKQGEQQSSALTAAEVEALRKQVSTLQKELQDKQTAVDQNGTRSRTIPGTASVATPLKGLAQTRVNDAEVIVRYTDAAISLTRAEQQQLREALQGIVHRGKAKISVEVPKGFSEAKRLGFYRAMTVRNLLLDMKLPKERINVVIIEGKASANAAIVRVTTP